MDSLPRFISSLQNALSKFWTKMSLYVHQFFFKSILISFSFRNSSVRPRELTSPHQRYETGAKSSAWSCWSGPVWADFLPFWWNPSTFYWGNSAESTQQQNVSDEQNGFRKDLKRDLRKSVYVLNVLKKNWMCEIMNSPAAGTAAESYWGASPYSTVLQRQNLPCVIDLRENRVRHT